MIILLVLLWPFLNTTTIILLVAIVGYATYFYRYMKKQHRVWQEKGVKHLKPKFLFGNTDRKREKPFVEQQQELYKQFPEERYYGIYQFLQPTLIVKDPDLIKLITVKEFDHFVDRLAFAGSDSDPMWSKNMFASKGEKWRDLRSTLSPSFTSSKMRFMYGLMEECVLQFVAFFRSDPSEIIELEMKDTWRRFTNDVIASAAFGIKCNSLEETDNEFLRMGTEATDFGRGRIYKSLLNAFSPKISKLLKIRFIPAHVSNYFSKIIQANIKSREEKHIVRPDMIHLLMEAKKGREQQEEDIKIDEGFSSVEESEMHKNRRKKEITPEDIIAQAFIFFFAGFETVSTLLTFISYELAVNPDVQTRLRKEIESVDKLTYESLLSLKYLDMVISESLRKWPPAILMDRAVTKPVTIPPVRPGEKPLHLENGLNCWFPIYSLHRDPNLYSEPDKFDPERFNDENKHKIHPFGYIPFGAGPRNCIGSRFALLEGKLMVAHLLKNFEIVPVERTPIPMVLDKKQATPTAKGGMWLGFKKIN